MKTIDCLPASWCGLTACLPVSSTVRAGGAGDGWHHKAASAAGVACYCAWFPAHSWPGNRRDL